MAFPQTPLAMRVEIFRGSTWLDITSSVRGESGITITRGRANEQGDISPSRCSLTINNRLGTYSPRNPLSSLYGLIGRNTPLRVRCEELVPSPSLRSSITTGTGTGLTVVCNTPTSVALGDGMLAFHSYDAVTTDAATAPTGGGWALISDTATSATSEFRTAVWWRVAGSTEPASYTFNADAAGSDSVVHIAAIKDCGAQTPSVAALQEAAPGTTFTTAGLFPSGDTDFELRLAAGVKSTGQAVTFTAPAGYAELVDTQVGTSTAQTIASKTLTSRADQGDKDFTASNGTLDVAHGVTVLVGADNIRFVGEVEAWPARWDNTGTDVYVPITATGVLRRLDQGQTPLRSSISRGIQRAYGSHLMAYWPMEDAAGSTSFSNEVASGKPMRIAPVTFPTNVTAAGGTQIGAATAPLVTFDVGSQLRGLVPPWTVTDAGWTVAALFYFEGQPDGITRAPMTWITGGTIRTWRMYNDIATDRWILQGYDSGGVLQINETLFDLVTVLAGQWIWLACEATQQGGNIEYSYYVQSETANEAFTATFAGTIGAVSSLLLSYGGGTGTTTSVGHAHVLDSATYLLGGAAPAAFLTGQKGETAAARISRLCAEEGLAVQIIGDPDATAAVGSQRIATLVELLDDAANADQGILYEPRDFAGLAYRTNGSLYNQTAALALDYTAKHLSDPFEPTDDDQLVRNDVTVTRTGGSFGRKEVTSGPLNVNDPADDPEGVGRYDEGISLNLELDGQAAQVAGWRAHLGTWDEERYPVVAVELERAPFVASATLKRAAALLDIGDRFTIDNLPAWMPPGLVGQLMQGSSEVLSNKGWGFRWNCSPAGPYSVAVLDSDTLGKLESSGSELIDVLTTSTTSFEVEVPAGPLWTTDSGEFPFDVMMAGEQMTVTDIDPSLVTFGATGTVAHAVNANVTPTIPAGVATGNLLLVLVAIRNSGAGFVAGASGYVRLPVFDADSNVQLYGKVATSAAEGSPTFSFIGGVANADTSAQMVRLGGRWGAVEEVVANARQQLNASAQDIAYPFLVPKDRDCIVLYLGWKQDDWTSVAAIAGATEIGEPDTTTGDDQGIAWDYVIQTTRALIPAGSFVVTGGAAAISRSAVVALQPRKQLWTVTRSVNGVSKVQAPGAALKLVNPAVLAL